MNLVVLCSTPGSRDSPGLRSAPQHWVIFVNTKKYKDQSVNMHKNPPNKIQINKIPTLTGRS